MILVDSSVWIDYFRGSASTQADRLDALLETQLIAIGDLMVVEVLQSCVGDSDFQRMKRLLESVQVVGLCGRELAIRAARNYRLLRASGITIRSTIDVILATRCIAEDIPLLYGDRDFDPFVKHLGLRSALMP